LGCVAKDFIGIPRPSDPEFSRWRLSTERVCVTHVTKSGLWHPLLPHYASAGSTAGRVRTRGPHIGDHSDLEVVVKRKRVALLLPVVAAAAALSITVALGEGGGT